MHPCGLVLAVAWASVSSPEIPSPHNLEASPVGTLRGPCFCINPFPPFCSHSSVCLMPWLLPFPFWYYWCRVFFPPDFPHNSLFFINHLHIWVPCTEMRESCILMQSPLEVAVKFPVTHASPLIRMAGGCPHQVLMSCLWFKIICSGGKWDSFHKT